MEGSVDRTEQQTEPDRSSQLEQELRERMQEVARLRHELQCARADARVKDEFIAVLNQEADKLQRIRALIARAPLGQHVTRAVERRVLGAGGGAAQPSDRSPSRASGWAGTTRAGARRIRRRLHGLVRPEP